MPKRAFLGMMTSFSSADCHLFLRRLRLLPLGILFSSGIYVNFWGSGFDLAFQPGSNCGWSFGPRNKYLAPPLPCRHPPGPARPQPPSPQTNNPPPSIVNKPPLATCSDAFSLSPAPQVEKKSMSAKYHDTQKAY